MRLKKYRFFNMGKDHEYLDDYANRAIMQKVARECYLPMNELLAGLIRKNGKKFKVSFSISGIAVEQIQDVWRPKCWTASRRWRVRAASSSWPKRIRIRWRRWPTGRIRGSGEAALCVDGEGIGVKPTAFRNTELIYSDHIGEVVASMGFRTMLAEGAKHVLGWKSPNYVYANAIDQKLHLLLRNFKLSDDIAFRFSDRGWSQWPLTAEKYVSWLNNPELPGEVINLFMDYETFGEHQKADSGIFEFMKHLPNAALATGSLKFATPTEVSKKFQPVAILHAPYPISWADEERDITAWLGNELQNEAFKKLYALKDKIRAINHPDFYHAWNFMQVSDHFYYMATKWFSDGDVHSYFNPYESPYEAFINYMNVLSDFEIEVDRKYKETMQESVPA